MSHPPSPVPSLIQDLYDTPFGTMVEGDVLQARLLGQHPRREPLFHSLELWRTCHFSVTSKLTLALHITPPKSATEDPLNPAFPRAPVEELQNRQEDDGQAGNSRKQAATPSPSAAAQISAIQRLLPPELVHTFVSRWITGDGPADRKEEMATAARLLADQLAQISILPNLETEYNTFLPVDKESKTETPTSPSHFPSTATDKSLLAVEAALLSSYRRWRRRRRRQEREERKQKQEPSTSGPPDDQDKGTVLLAGDLPSKQARQLRAQMELLDSQAWSHPSAAAHHSGPSSSLAWQQRDPLDENQPTLVAKRSPNTEAARSFLSAVLSSSAAAAPLVITPQLLGSRNLAAQASTKRQLEPWSRQTSPNTPSAPPSTSSSSSSSAAPSSPVSSPAWMEARSHADRWQELFQDLDDSRQPSHEQLSRTGSPGERGCLNSTISDEYPQWEDLFPGLAWEGLHLRLSAEERRAAKLAVSRISLPELIASGGTELLTWDEDLRLTASLRWRDSGPKTPKEQETPPPSGHQSLPSSPTPPQRESKELRLARLLSDDRNRTTLARQTLNQSQKTDSRVGYLPELEAVQLTPIWRSQQTLGSPPKQVFRIISIARSSTTSLPQEKKTEQESAPILDPTEECTRRQSRFFASAPQGFVLIAAPNTAARVTDFRDSVVLPSPSPHPAFSRQETPTSPGSSPEKLPETAELRTRLFVDDAGFLHLLSQALPERPESRPAMEGTRDQLLDELLSDTLDEDGEANLPEGSTSSYILPDAEDSLSLLTFQDIQQLLHTPEEDLETAESDSMADSERMSSLSRSWRNRPSIATLFGSPLVTPRSRFPTPALGPLATPRSSPSSLRLAALPSAGTPSLESHPLHPIGSVSSVWSPRKRGTATVSPSSSEAEVKVERAGHDPSSLPATPREDSKQTAVKQKKMKRVSVRDAALLRRLQKQHAEHERQSETAHPGHSIQSSRKSQTEALRVVEKDILQTGGAIPRARASKNLSYRRRSIHPGAESPGMVSRNALTGTSNLSPAAPVSALPGPAIHTSSGPLPSPPPIIIVS